MSILDVPGARLYYESRGDGPVMIMVPGANGDANAFTMVGDRLAREYRVVTYDRRGFSRSTLDGPQDYDHRLQSDADDARRLIEHLSDEPATVFGASSGGIVALELLARHPCVVAALIAFEPAAVTLLPDGQQWVEFFLELYDLYRQTGIAPAQARYREHAFAASDRLFMARAMDPENSEQVRANATYWFEHELRQYPAVRLDVDALKAHTERVVLVVGRESRGRPCYEVNVELGRALGRDVVELPGGHVGFATHPGDFAQELLRVLGHTERPSRK